MKKFFDVEIDGQVELENGKTLGELKESSISITDADVENGGDGAMMVVNATYDEQTDTITFDKTFDEIFASVPNVVAKYVDDGCVYKLEEYDENIINFGYTNIGIANGVITVITHDRLQLESNNIVSEIYGEINF